MSFSINKAFVQSYREAQREARRGIETTLTCMKCNEKMLIGRT